MATEHPEQEWRCPCCQMTVEEYDEYLKQRAKNAAPVTLRVGANP